MRVVGVIQARLSSSRLPGKILFPLAGTPLLGVLAERTRPARFDECWLATSVEPADQLTAAWGASLGLKVHRGSLDDVLSRFTAIARLTQADWIVRLTADDPFTNATVVDALIDAAHEAPAECDLIGDGLGPERKYPLGYVPQAVRARALFEAEKAIPDTEPHHRAHVVSWLLEDKGYRVLPATPTASLRPAWRWTVDTARDYEMASAAFDLFGDRWPTISYVEMVRALDERHDIPALNQNERQKAQADG